MQIIKRGDIYYADLNPVSGSEQGGNRPVVVVQNNIGNTHSPTVIVVPITSSRQKSRLPTHVDISSSYGLEADSVILTEQIRTIDRSRIQEYIGHIGNDVAAKINKAISISVGISQYLSFEEETLTLSLCGRCEKTFSDSSRLVIKKPGQKYKSECDFCGRSNGWLFSIFR